LGQRGGRTGRGHHADGEVRGFQRFEQAVSCAPIRGLYVKASFPAYHVIAAAQPPICTVRPGRSGRKGEVRVQRGQNRPRRGHPIKRGSNPEEGRPTRALTHEAASRNPCLENSFKKKLASHKGCVIVG
jgi:hypothetical protein